jgi:hypothetical protein
VYSEKRAPNSATEATMVAASRNGDGATDVETVEEIRSRSAVASKIRRSKRGIDFFILVTNFVFGVFCLKAFLSRFLDSETEFLSGFLDYVLP